jgi:hypothetical protein
MSEAQGTTAKPGQIMRDSVLITCPPVPNGPGNGLSLAPSFTVCGSWDTDAANYNVTCVFQTTNLAAAGTNIQPLSLTINPNKTWSADFSINAGTNGTLKAQLFVNGVAVQTSYVYNLQVVANGGTCTCG